MKFLFFFIFGLLTSSLFANGKAHELSRNPIIRITDSGYRVIWNNNKNTNKITLKHKTTEYLMPKENYVNYHPSGYFVDVPNINIMDDYILNIPNDRLSIKGAGNFTCVIMSDHQTFPNLTELGFRMVKSEKPSMIVSLGDMIEDGKLKNWERNFFPYVNILKGIPMVPVMGNNDTGMGLFNSFWGLENGYYTAHYGPLYFIVLNTNEPLKEGSPQYQWLEEKLNFDAKWKIVLMHKGPLCSIKDKKNFRNYDKFMKLLEENGVKLCLSGHHHVYDRTRAINGVTYITIPSLSGVISNEDFDTNLDYYNKTIDNFRGYAVMKVEDDLLKFTIKDTTKRVLDSFSIR